MNKQFNLWRALAVTAALIISVGGVAWHKGLLQPRGVSRPANSIMVLMPYRHAGTWVFDDKTVGLRQEPFVAGIPELSQLALARLFKCGKFRLDPNFDPDL